jgi:lysophospholipase L1-like esterase
MGIIMHTVTQKSATPSGRVSNRRLIPIVLIVALVVSGVALLSDPRSIQYRRAVTISHVESEPTIRKFEQQDRQSPPPRDAVVFVGSSSIARWNLPESFPELGSEAINRGISGSLLADSAYFADRIVAPYKPRMVVLYAGDNDIDVGASPDEIVAWFAEFEQRVHARDPGVRIVFVSIKPSILRWSMIGSIREANQKVADYCTAHPYLKFLDIEPQMLSPAGQPRPELLLADGIHLTSAGYRLWTEALRPLLENQS